MTSLVRLPAAIPSSATIGPQGGSIQSSDGRLTLKVPAGALTQPVAFSIAAATNDAPNALGSAYDVSPDAIFFARPALLVFKWASTEINGIGSSNLGLAVQGASGWSGIGGGSLDLLNGVLIVPVSSTSASLSKASPAALLAGGSRRIASYGAVGLDPPPPLCALAGKTRILSVTYVGPGSASASGMTPLSAGASRSDLTAAWSLTQGSPGSLKQGDLSATYVAPVSPPGIQPAEVKVVIEASGTPRIRPISRSVPITVIPTRGTLKVKTSLAVTCSNPTVPFEFSVVDESDFGFTINDDYGITVSALGSQSERTTNPCASWQPGICRGQNLETSWLPSQVTIPAGQFECHGIEVTFKRVMDKTMTGPNWTGTCKDVQSGMDSQLPVVPLVQPIKVDLDLNFGAELITGKPLKFDIGVNGAWLITAQLTFGNQ